jgi:hypothetical protein
MFKTLYRCPLIVARHDNDPPRESRARCYLEHLSAQSAALHTLRCATAPRADRLPGPSHGVNFTVCRHRALRACRRLGYWVSFLFETDPVPNALVRAWPLISAVLPTGL